MEEGNVSVSYSTEEVYKIIQEVFSSLNSISILRIESKLKEEFKKQTNDQLLQEIIDKLISANEHKINSIIEAYENIKGNSVILKYLQIFTDTADLIEEEETGEYIQLNFYIQVKTAKYMPIATMYLPLKLSPDQTSEIVIGKYYGDAVIVKDNIDIKKLLDVLLSLLREIEEEKEECDNDS
ncbi:MAG: hypothetical protein ACP5G1_04110 [Nanopusillaceae archaeon]